MLTKDEELELLYLLELDSESEKKIDEFLESTDNKEFYNNVYYEGESEIVHDDVSDFIVIKGSRNSGKSRAVVQTLTRKLIREKSILLVVRKRYNSLEKSVYSEFKNVFTQFEVDTSNFLSSVTKSPLSIKFKNGSEVIFAGLDNEDSTKSIANIDYIYFEEIDAERDETVINTVANSMRSTSSSGQKKQIYMTFNPPEATHWLKKRFFDPRETPFKIKSFTTTYKDNRWCTEFDAARLEELKHIDITQYRRDALGEWGIPDDESGCVRPIDMETAFINHEQNLVKPHGQYAMGVDVAGDGSDRAVGYFRKGLKIIDRFSLKKCSQPELLDRVIMMVNDNYKDDKLELVINFDATGIGTGTAEFCKKHYKSYKRITVNKVNNGARAKNPDMYKNCGAEMYLNLRDITKKISVSRNLGENLPVELCMRRFFVNEMRQFCLEKKDDYKKRIGSSPDEGDAFALCFYEPYKRVVKEVNLKIW